MRLIIFARDGWQCVLCAKKGVVTACQEVDHIIPATRYRGDFYDRSNLQSLCRECHKLKSADEVLKKGGFNPTTGRPTRGYNSREAENARR